MEVAVWWMYLSLLSCVCNAAGNLCVEGRVQLPAAFPTVRQQNPSKRCYNLQDQLASHCGKEFV